jgi:uncharacterized membrane protein required for colicin V production
MVIDLVVIVVICLCSAIGFKRGFLKSLFSIFIFGVSLYLTYILTPVVINVLQPLIDKIDIGNTTTGGIISNILNSNNLLAYILFN